MRQSFNALLDRLSDRITASPSVEPDDGPSSDTETTHRAYADDAHAVATALHDRFDPDSVLHIGCGIGLHLKPFLDADIDARGIDGSTVAHDRAVIPTDRITITDLTRPYTTDHDYDLVLCFDLLAHSPDQLEDTLIRTIADAGTTAVISPITTEQAGFATQDDDYWITRFNNAGMQLQQPATDWFRDRLADIQWAPHRPLIFTK